MLGLVTQQAINAQAAAVAEKAFGPQRPYLIAGHAADSPANQPDRSPIEVTVPGSRVGYEPIAEAVATHGVPRTQVYPAQATAPGAQPQAFITTTPTNTAAASSISDHPGSALVQQLDYRMPTGVVPNLTAAPAQAPFHTAPTRTPGA